MPTYRLQCQHCAGEIEVWRSIKEHDTLPTTHDAQVDPFNPDVLCKGTLIQVIANVRTYGVGDRGTATRTADARERELDKDRPAYKRLRDEGHQPRSLRGAHELEARATDDWFIKTGGLVSVPDDKRLEVNEAIADAKTSGWNPVAQMHHERNK